MRGDDRLARQERLERDVAEVLVERRIDDRQRARVELDQLVVVDVAEERPRGRLDAALRRGQRLDVVALRAVAGDDQPERAERRRHRADDEIDALDRLEPPDREHVVAVAARLRAAPASRGG